MIEAWDMGGISTLGVFVATAVAFALGGLWYSPALFGKIWMREAGITEEKCGKGPMALTFFTTFVLAFTSTVLLAFVLGPRPTVLHGGAAGLAIGLGWVSTSIGTNYLFEGKSGTYFAITAGYHIVRLFITGVILGLI